MPDEVIGELLATLRRADEQPEEAWLDGAQRLAAEPTTRAMRVLEDLTILKVEELHVGYVLISRSTAQDVCLGVWSEGWYYRSVDAACAALGAWTDEPEPSGWVRHLPSNRRRPDGDPAREYVRR